LDETVYDFHFSSEVLSDIIHHTGVCIIMKQLEPNNSLPYYEQVKELLRQKIATGIFKADTAVPDERALGTEYGISNVTVCRALVELANEGLLKRVRGRGTFVRSSFAPQLYLL
jgi:DNA-binding GntR family transcriptional regulator